MIISFLVLILEDYLSFKKYFKISISILWDIKQFWIWLDELFNCYMVYQGQVCFAWRKGRTYVIRTRRYKLKTTRQQILRKYIQNRRIVSNISDTCVQCDTSSTYEVFVIPRNPWRRGFFPSSTVLVCKFLSQLHISQLKRLESINNCTIIVYYLY